MAKRNEVFENVEQWLGIPYAKAGRFQKPELVVFDPEKEYDKYGPVSVQMVPLSYLGAEQMSEDCLYLNVYAPANRHEPLPVVVYIHGGGWSYGGNTQVTSNPAGLVASGRVIGVSINYRLGALGWMQLAQYGGIFKDATNLGMQDMVTALRWVHKNIAGFGGNPDEVTVIGHSGGAYSALALTAVPRADGLFRRVAAFSGFISRYIPQWWAEEWAHKTIEALKLHHPEDLLTVDATLLNETAEKLLPADYSESHGVDNICLSIVDDHELPDGLFCMNPIEFFRKGSRKDIDILVSSTTGEVDWYALNDREEFDPGSVEAIADELVSNSHIPRSRSEAIVGYQLKQGERQHPADVRAAVYTDFNFTLPATRTTLNHAKGGGRAWQLNIGPVEGFPAVHGTEMHAIVGQSDPEADQAKRDRDAFVTRTVLDFATANYDDLWTPVGTEPQIHDIGLRPYTSNQHHKDILKLFDGIERQ